MNGLRWLVSACLVVLLGTAAAGQVSQVAPEGAPSAGTAVPASEPGQALVLKGHVRDAQSGRPVANASLYFYQTDAAGLYTPDGANDNRNPRLRLYLRSDGAGRYEVRTIRPGAYPQQPGPPAHVHVVANAPGFARRVFEFVFDDDPLLTPRIRDLAAAQPPAFVVVKPRPSGVGAEVEQDILLYPGS